MQGVVLEIGMTDDVGVARVLLDTIDEEEIRGFLNFHHRRVNGNVVDVASRPRAASVATTSFGKSLSRLTAHCPDNQKS